jgi:hypothetical protein
MISRISGMMENLCGRYGLDIRRTREKRWKMEEEKHTCEYRGWVSYFSPTPTCDSNTKGWIRF